MGMLARSVGETAQAESLLAQAAAIRRDLGDEAGLTVTLNNLSLVQLERSGPAERTARPAVEAMVRFLSVADVDGVIETLEACVGLAVTESRWTAAARLAGAARAARRRHALPGSPSERRPVEARVDEIRERLGDETFSTALHEGEKLTLEEATGYIVTELLES